MTFYKNIKICTAIFLLFLTGCTGLTIQSSKQCLAITKGDYNLYAQANEWLIHPKRQELTRLSNIEPYYFKNCSKISKNEYINWKQKVLISGRYTATSENLCISSPTVYLTPAHSRNTRFVKRSNYLHDRYLKQKDRQLKELFLEQKHLVSVLKGVSEIIQSQCSTIPNQVNIDFKIQYPSIVDDFKEKKEQVFNSIYKGTFLPNIYLQYGNVSYLPLRHYLKDNDPSVRKKIEAPIIARNEKRAWRNAEAMERKEKIRKFNEAYDQLIDATIIGIQGFFQAATLEFGDEGICFFLNSGKNNSFSKKQYTACKNYLNDLKIKAYQDNQLAYVIGALAGSLNTNVHDLVPRGNNRLTKAASSAIGSCIDELITTYGAATNESPPTSKELIDNCSFGAQFGTVQSIILDK